MMTVYNCMFVSSELYVTITSLIFIFYTVQLLPEDVYCCFTGHYMYMYIVYYSVYH